MRLSFLLAIALACCLVAVADVTTVSGTKSTPAGTFAITGVRIDLKDPKIGLKVGLAWDHVGRVESLASIAKRCQALAAINGSFFDAYTSDEIKNPDMTLISDGQLLFKSNIGTLLGFEEDNTPHIGCVRHRLVGTITRENGRAQDWFAYYVNRKPTAFPCVTMFNRLWADTVPPLDGAAVVVANGTVAEITRGEVAVPENGYVVHVRGEDRLLGNFHVGDRVAFTPQVTVESDDEKPECWAKVREAVGAGPRVLAHGKPVFAPEAESFSDPKILQRSGARSVIGYTADNVLYLITVRNARVPDLGHILKALGCVEGMNLDGGASSGLWYRGKYLTTPGRNISNALLIVEKK